MDFDSPVKSNAQTGSEIERPPSALHAGDFTQHEHRTNDFPTAFHADLDRIERSAKLATRRASPPTPWYKPLPSSRLEPDSKETSPSIDIPDRSKRTGTTRNRAPSLHSYSSSFVLKPPTSPLVHQSNNDDLDCSPIDLSSSPSKSSRRHTLPPHGFQGFKAQPLTLAQAARRPPSLQRENSFPYQAHQIRIPSTSNLPFGSSPPYQIPSFLRSRRPSFASDASPIQHASMVGSYEESILRGRMSTMPSKPLDFTAQIGALGRDNCKPKYPAHVSVDFPAVYYSWSSTQFGTTLNEPSPYVGLIDLEHKLEVPSPKERRRRRRERLRLDDQDGLSEASNGAYNSRRKEKRKRRSPSPTLMTGGCYRIPQQGQLQILIRNPHKTAVKLFLVPYDLEGMTPGTKTFVRQRCYSGGPIIERPLTSRSVSEPGLEARLASLDSNTRPTLRYLVQLNIGCPSKGRYYLYKNIHVVFANRVPDNKEKLQTETLWPEPRYSAWKPSVSSENAFLTGNALGSASTRMTRSRSYGEPNCNEANFQNFQGLQDSTKDFDTGVENERFSPLPIAHTKLFDKARTELKENLPLSQRSFGQGTTFLGQKEFEQVEANNSLVVSQKNSYTKLNRGEAGYGGVFGRPATPEAGEGLLARQLKGLDVEQEMKR